MSHEPTDRLRLSLDFLFGRGFLTLSKHALNNWALIPHMRLEIPGLSFPMDLRGGAERFTQHRNKIVSLRLAISESELSILIERWARRLSGIDTFNWRLREREIEVELKTSDEAGGGRIVARYGVVPPEEPDAYTLRLIPLGTLAIGSFAKPPSLILTQTLSTLLDPPWQRPLVPEWRAKALGDELQVPVLEWLCSDLFISRGWKLPAREDAQLDSVEIRAGQLAMSFSSKTASRRINPHTGEPSINNCLEGATATRALRAIHQRSLLRLSEQAFFREDLDSALAALSGAQSYLKGSPLAFSRKAEILLHSGLPHGYDELLRDCEERLHQDPQDVPALAALVQVAQHRGRLEDERDARERLLHALAEAQQHSESISVRLDAIEQERERAPELAMRLLHDALRLAPHHPDVLAAAINLSRQQGALDLLEDVLSRSLRLPRRNTDRARYGLELAELISARAHDHSRALQLLEGLPAVDEFKGELASLKARIAERDGRPHEALRQWSALAAHYESVGDNLNEAAARAECARLWLEPLNDADSALSALAHAAQLDPQNAHILLQAMEAGIAAGELLSALEYGERGLGAVEAYKNIDAKAPPEELYLRLLEGVAEIHRERAERARTAALSATPPQRPTPPTSSPSAVVEPSSAGDRQDALSASSVRERTDRDAKTFIHTSTHHNKKDIAVQIDALKIRINSTTDSLELGALYAELGELQYHDLYDSEAARPNLEAAMELDPEGVGSRYSLLSALESIYDESGDADKLAQLYELRAKQSAEDQLRSAYGILRASTLWSRLGQPEAALDQLAETLALEPGLLAALRLKAEILEATGDSRGAARALAEAIDSPSSDAIEARELLRKLGYLEWRALNQLDNAASRFRRLANELPGDHEALVALKSIYIEAGDNARASEIVQFQLSVLRGHVDEPLDLDELLSSTADELLEALRPDFAELLFEYLELNPELPLPTLKRVTALARQLAPDDHRSLEASVALARREGDSAALALTLAELSELLLDGAERDAIIAELDELNSAEHLGTSDDADAGAEEPAPDIAAPKAPLTKKLYLSEAAGDGSTDPETTADLINRLDAMVKSGGHEAALGLVAEALGRVHSPGERMALLLRRGRWILDLNPETRDAIFTLKGALILDDSDADIYLELARALALAGDPRAAAEQLRAWSERADESPPWQADGLARPRWRALKKALEPVLPEGLLAWLKDNHPPSAAALRGRL